MWFKCKRSSSDYFLTAFILQLNQVDSILYIVLYMNAKPAVPQWLYQ